MYIFAADNLTNCYTIPDKPKWVITLVKQTMENYKETQTRRQFFKEAARKTLPIFGAMALINNPVIARTLHVVSNDCNNSSCTNSCIDVCRNSCNTMCHKGCKGCNGSCEGSCLDSCKNSNK